MDLTFTPWRIAALVALMIGYALFGGFVAPPEGPISVTRTWAVTIALFVVGAIQATVVDHFIGTGNRSNLRWFHIVVGICLMAMAATLRHRLEGG